MCCVRRSCSFPIIFAGDIRAPCVNPTMGSFRFPCTRDGGWGGLGRFRKMILRPIFPQNLDTIRDRLPVLNTVSPPKNLPTLTRIRPHATGCHLAFKWGCAVFATLLAIVSGLACGSGKKHHSGIWGELCAWCGWGRRYPKVRSFNSPLIGPVASSYTRITPLSYP